MPWTGPRAPPLAPIPGDSGVAALGSRPATPGAAELLPRAADGGAPRRSPGVSRETGTARRAGGRSPSSGNAGPHSAKWRSSATSPASTGSRPCARWRRSRRRAIASRRGSGCWYRRRTGARGQGDCGDRPPRAAMRGARPRGVRLPLRQGAPSPGDRLQRQPSAGGTASYYDLLASEARLCPFVAIAQGQLPQETWFALGRLLTATGGEPILLSWSGSMFEYLMPLLVMPTYENTLLDQTCKAAVRRQIEYGKQRGVPWGISESGYNLVDVQPQLSVPRVRGARPRAQARPGRRIWSWRRMRRVLALMVAPEAACRNLQRLERQRSSIGKYGFYEAIDYTPSRLPRGQSSAVVRSFMAHHQGMSLLSLAYLLLDRPMQKRFESDPLFQATTLLLQERVPKATASYAASPPSSPVAAALPASPRCRCASFGTPDTPVPEVQLLSNGSYHVMVTNAGRRLQPLEGPRGDALARGRHLRQLGNVSATSATCRAASSGRPRTSRRSSVRRSTRRSSRRRGWSFAAAITISIPIRKSPFPPRTTSRFAGSASSTAPGRAGRSSSRATPKSSWPRPPPTRCTRHSATSSSRPRSFAQRQAILCTRRPRSADEPAPWMFHLMVVRGAQRRGGFLRDRPHAVSRPGQHRRRSAGDARHRGPVGQPGIRPRSDRRDPAPDHARARTRRRPSTWSPASGKPGTSAWASSRSTRTGASPIASSSWRGPTARCCCSRSTPPRPTRSSTAASPAPSSTPIRCCAPTRASSARTAADNPACGATPYPAICRSCCCRSETRPTSSWCASSCRPTRTGG